MEAWMGQMSVLWSEVYSMTYEQAASVLKMELSKCRTDFYKDRRDALRLAIVCLECFAQHEVMDIDLFDDEDRTEEMILHDMSEVFPCGGLKFVDPGR